MTTDDYFKEEATDTKETEEVTKIKVGEKEYTQEELDRKIGLGEQAEEFEKKWNTKLPNLMKGFTQATQERESFKREIEDLKKAAPKIEEKLEAAGLTEEQKKVARQQLKDIIGDEPMTKTEFEKAVNTRVMDILAARDLLDAAQDIVDEAKEAGKPAITRQDLIDYMTETGERNPEWAYRKMFDKELKGWEAEQLKKAKPSLFSTITRPTAGATKLPEPVKVTRENMGRMVKDIFSRE